MLIRRWDILFREKNTYKKKGIYLVAIILRCHVWKIWRIPNVVLGEVKFQTANAFSTHHSEAYQKLIFLFASSQAWSSADVQPASHVYHMVTTWLARPKHYTWCDVSIKRTKVIFLSAVCYPLRGVGLKHLNSNHNHKKIPFTTRFPCPKCQIERVAINYI